MKKFLYLAAMLMFCAVSASASGEVWVPTNDHLFARNTYNDAGVPFTFDNRLSFMSGASQTLWIWFDDDEIYQNEYLQAFTPMFYDYDGGHPYNEITYSAMEFRVYLPSYISLSKPSSSQSVHYGDRLPSDDYAIWAKQNETAMVDGVSYDVYRVMIMNFYGYGAHFSAKNAAMYEELGALKKDDAPLLGLCLTLFDEGDLPDNIPDIIIAEQKFVVVEEQRVDGTKGSYIHEPFVRIKVYGNSGIPHTPGDLDSNGTVDINDVALLIDRVLGKEIVYYTDIDPEYMELMSDVNGDETVDINDVSAAISKVLNGN